MISNIQKYKADLEQLIADGEHLLDAIQYECFPKEFETAAKKALGTKSKGKIQELIKKLPSFTEKYQF
jgi:hypothetical protein